jgi:hypothetical protein
VGARGAKNAVEKRTFLASAGNSTPVAQVIARHYIELCRLRVVVVDVVIVGDVSHIRQNAEYL